MKTILTLTFFNMITISTYAMGSMVRLEKTIPFPNCLADKRKE